MTASAAVIVHVVTRLCFTFSIVKSCNVLTGRYGVHASFVRGLRGQNHSTQNIIKPSRITARGWRRSYEGDIGTTTSIGFGFADRQARELFLRYSDDICRSFPRRIYIIPKFFLQSNYAIEHFTTTILPLSRNSYKIFRKERTVLGRYGRDRTLPMKFIVTKESAYESDRTPRRRPLMSARHVHPSRLIAKCAAEVD